MKIGPGCGWLEVALKLLGRGYSSGATVLKKPHLTSLIDPDNKPFHIPSSDVSANTWKER